MPERRLQRAKRVHRQLHSASSYRSQLNVWRLVLNKTNGLLFIGFVNPLEICTHVVLAHLSKEHWLTKSLPYVATLLACEQHDPVRTVLDYYSCGFCQQENEFSPSQTSGVVFEVQHPDVRRYGRGTKRICITM